MKIEFSSKCLKRLQRIKKNDVVLYKKIQKQLILFQQKPDHPSLRLHKLGGGQNECWSVSVGMSQRILFYFRQDKRGKVAVFFTVGKHEEVYK